MPIDFRKMTSYAWMSQASYRGFQGIQPNDAVSLNGKLTDNADPGADKKFANSQADTWKMGTEPDFFSGICS